MDVVSVFGNLVREVVAKGSKDLLHDYRVDLAVSTVFVATISAHAVGDLKVGVSLDAVYYMVLQDD